MRLLVKSVLILAAAVLVAAAGAIAWVKFAPRHVPEGQRALSTLTSESLPAFRSAFNDAEGQVRILAMLSPT